MPTERRGSSAFGEHEEKEESRQHGGFILSCWMFKPLSLLLIGLLAAGPLLAQTEPNKSPAKDAEKPPTLKEPGKKPAEQSPPPAPGQSPATAPNVSTDASAKPQLHLTDGQTRYVLYI